MNTPRNSSASSLEDLVNLMDNPEFALLSTLSNTHLELPPNLISPISSPELFTIPLPPDSPPKLPPLPPSSEDFPLYEFQELVIDDDQKEAKEKRRKGKEKVQDNSNDNDDAIVHLFTTPHRHDHDHHRLLSSIVEFFPALASCLVVTHYHHDDGDDDSLLPYPSTPHPWPSSQHREHISSLEKVQQETDDDNSNDEHKASIIEIKSRKAMMKLGLQPVKGVTRVTFIRNNNVHVISNPDVFKSRSSTTYVIFGEISIEDTSSLRKAREELMKLYDNSNYGESYSIAGQKKEEDKKEDDDDDVEVDPRDIELVVKQTGISWNQANKELKDADNDIIAVIMDHMVLN
ncbi:nascent polypeptide-associated complex subunit alpha-like protein 1 [Senna tora]|uniref:Nascent polypeptide-associated complex subunit alpha-like protein 1 n=1 Tax=Senna tora TaxID=362788 RepID=A0A834T8D1_9FABA|nr:nascent polypeptide-associated complex subunit alpha-like protein 1 [Senna tora]